MIKTFFARYLGLIIMVLQAKKINSQFKKIK